MNRWSDEEIKILLNNYSKSYKTLLILLPNKTYGRICYMKKKFNLRLTGEDRSKILRDVRATREVKFTKPSICIHCHKAKLENIVTLNKTYAVNVNRIEKIVEKDGYYLVYIKQRRLPYRSSKTFITIIKQKLEHE